MSLTSAELDRYSKILSHSQLFNGIDEAALKALIQGGEVRSFEGQEFLIQEDNRVEGLSVILSGAAKVQKLDTSLTMLGRGAFYGEISLFGVSLGATASLIAHEPTTVFTITKKNLDVWAQHYPKAEVMFLKKMCTELCRRLYATSERASQ